MTAYLIGAQGRLGRAIIAEGFGENFVSLERSVYEDWAENGAENKISNYFKKKKAENSVIFVTSGVLDPRVPEEEHFRVNYFLPKNIIRGASRLGFKVVTFGTVMEDFIRSRPNSYIKSKVRLREDVERFAAKQFPVLHLQLHTLYGLELAHPFMFLGQLVQSIKSGVPLEMTSGQQLREYHHYADDAKAIRALAETSITGALHLSHGESLSLKTIAQYIFQFFEKPSLLHLGALPDPKEENYHKKFIPNEMIAPIRFRKTLPALTKYIKDQCIKELS